MNRINDNQKIFFKVNKIFLVLSLLMVIVACAIMPTAPESEIIREISKFLPADGEQFDGAHFNRFGFSVAIDGDYAIVGAYHRYFSSAYIFVRNGSGWVQQAKLEAESNNYFGISVAISGNTAIIGAVKDNQTENDSGAAFVFTRSGTTWSQQQKLIASDNVGSFQWFGQAVAILGDTAIVSSRAGAVGVIRVAGTETQVITFFDKVTGGAATYNGAIYIFTRNGNSWTEQQIIRGDNNFGVSISIDDDTLLVGASRVLSESSSEFSGAAYVFTRSGTTWSQQARLLASDRAGNDRFGQTVALDSDTAVIGAPTKNGKSYYEGAVYVFTRDGTNWTEETKIKAAGVNGSAAFGNSVDIDGDMMLVGSWNDSQKGLGSGSAYLFTGSGANWTQQAKILNESDSFFTNDWFGFSVALDGDTAIVGVPLEDPLDNSNNVIVNSGSAYIYQLQR